MTREASVLIHWRGLENEEAVHRHLADRCHHIAGEFPETDHYELFIEPDGSAIQCHGHVNGKGLVVAAHAEGLLTPRHAADSVLAKLERELRKEHDKRIFTQRRKARRSRFKYPL